MRPDSGISESDIVELYRCITRGCMDKRLGVAFSETDNAKSVRGGGKDCDRAIFGHAPPQQFTRKSQADLTPPQLDLNQL
jgi:hypothetical protein